MKEGIKFTAITFFIAAVLVVSIIWPLPSCIIFATILLVIGFYDIIQKKQSILKNFPVIGQMRYLMEMIWFKIHLLMASP